MNAKTKASALLLGLLVTATALADSGPSIAVAKAKLPDGFKLTLYTAETPEARSMALGDDGTVYVGTTGLGKVYAVRDTDGDGRAEQAAVVASGLNLPNGVAFHRGALYVAELNRVIRFDGIGGKFGRPFAPQVVYGNLPDEKHHGYRPLRVGPDGKLYLGLGAPCNVCKPAKDSHGALARMNADGSQFEIIARGVRNSVGFDWQPGTGDLFFTDNGRDWLGDDQPPDELNRLERLGQHFGFPYCHGGNLTDPQFGKERPCGDFTAPVWRFPAHVAALGMRFYTGTEFPPQYRGQLFVAQHGSWNRSIPRGYRVVSMKFEQNRPGAESVFIDGWLGADGKALARPVDVLQMPDGAMLVSDELNGALYRVNYRK